MKKMVGIVALFLIAGFFVAAQEIIKPAPIGVDELFAQMEKRPERIQSVRFDYVQGIAMKGQMLESEGKGALASSGKLRMSTHMSNQAGEIFSTLTSDGEAMWHEVRMGEEMHVARYDLAALGVAVEANLSGLGIWGVLNHKKFDKLKEQVLRDYDVRVLGIDKSGKVPVYLIDVQAKSSPGRGGAPGGRIEVKLGVEDLFVRSKTTYDGAGNVLSKLVLDEPEFNAGVEESIFAYTPPAGVAVDDGNAMMKQLAGGEPRRRKGLLYGEAPDFTLEDLEGTKVNLKSLRGKTVLLDFWATWCGPCLQAMPHIQKIHEDFMDQDLVVLGINGEVDGREKAQRYMKKKGYTFTSLVDEGSQVTALYQIRGLPTTLVIDKEGVVQHYLVGLRPEQEVRAALAQVGVSAR